MQEPWLATLKVMISRIQTQGLTYDAYGEPAAHDRTGALSVGDRRIRNAAVAVFWTLALLLTAGRVYHGDHPFAPAAEAATPQFAAVN